MPANAHRTDRSARGIGCGGPVEALREYRFTTLLDSQDGLVPTRCPAINALGHGRGARGGHAARLRQAHHEAGRARRAGGRRAHGARRRTIRRSATTASPRSRRTRRSTSWAKWHSRATSAGCRRAEACATPEQRDTPRQGVFLGQGGPLTTIAHTNNPPGSDFISEFIVADVSVNSFGKVALAIETRGQPLFDQGLFVGSKRGTFDERFRNSTSEFDSPVVAHVAQRARADCVPGQRDRAVEPRRHVQDGSSTAAPSGLAVFDPSLNIFGRVAFMGFTSRRPAGDGHLHEPRRPVTTVADNPGRTSLVREAVTQRSRPGRLHRRPRRVRAERLPASGRVHRARIRCGTRCCRRATSTRACRCRASSPAARR